MHPSLNLPLISKRDKQELSVVDLHSKILDAPQWSKFFQCHAVFVEILAKPYVSAPLLRGLAPPPRRNPGSATDFSAAHNLNVDQ